MCEHDQLRQITATERAHKLGTCLGMSTDRQKNLILHCKHFFHLICKIDLIHSANMTGSVQDDELITPTERTHKLGTCLGMPTGSQKATSSALGDRLILTPPQKYDSVLS